MPNLFDYLLAPWKILSLLFSSPPPTAPGAPQAIRTGLCSIQDVGGQMLNVCHFAGYEMPSFIFWASFLILMAFAAASGSLIFQCQRLSRVLAKVTKQLEKVRAEARVMTGKELASIRTVMQKEKLLAPVWLNFEDTLLVSGQGEEIYGTESPDRIFSKQAIVEENVHHALFSAIPGILTGVGLLMTFVAILDGLSHVSVTANMDVQGIGGLINGLSGKFVSSIVAVTCAVSFVFVERYAYSAPDSAYRKLVHQLSARFKRKTTEQLLFHIQTQLSEQALLLEKLQGRTRVPEKAT